MCETALPFQPIGRRPLWLPLASPTTAVNYNQRLTADVGWLGLPGRKADYAKHANRRKISKEREALTRQYCFRRRERKRKLEQKAAEVDTN